jgi:nucleotide-binding universal stress UspA family protein
MAPAQEQVVVVGFDGGAESSSALRWALKEAVDRSATVEVVHCHLPASLTDAGSSSPHEMDVAAAQMLDDEVNAALQGMASPPDVRQCSVAGSPAQVLVARTGSAALLVIGVHRQTDLSDLILGRVGRECLRHARCPVVVVGLDQHVARHETPCPEPASTE